MFLAWLTWLPLVSSQDCPWAPIPEDPDFRPGPESRTRHFAACATALDLAGGRQQLKTSLIFGYPDETLGPRSCGDWHFEEVRVSPRYLVAVAAPEAARSLDLRQLVPVGACIPAACQAVFKDLALPMLMEWRGKVLYYPAPGPCAGHLEVDDQACQRHLRDEIFLESCVTGAHIWRLICDQSFYDSLFGAQIRSLPSDGLGSTDYLSKPQEVALRQYQQCKAGASSFLAVQFNAEDQGVVSGYALGMCIPRLFSSLSDSVEITVRWRLGTLLERHYPSLHVDVESITCAELIHRGELGIQWAIIGLGRSGTTSLATWLDSHPKLQLLSDSGDYFREGGLKYLFRKSHLEHLVRKEVLELLPQRKSRRARFGIKEPSLMRSMRGRQILAEMGRTKVLIIMKNWLDWLASSALFSANWSTPLCSPWSLASDASDCLLNFQEAHVSEHVMDLEQKGVARQRIKVLHLDVLMEQGSMALQRIAAFLGAGNETSTEPLPREGVTAVGHLEFFQELCALPRHLASRLERRKSLALHGAAELLRRSGEPVPPSISQPEPLQMEACRRAQPP